MSGTKSKEMDLTVGSPFWSLLKFAIPVILGNLFQLFYTLADSVIVGKTLGANSLAATLFRIPFSSFAPQRWPRQMPKPPVKPLIKQKTK